jgi:hypothetical protein
MAALTNSYHNCELLNLGSGPNGRGPFIIRQEGTPPGSMTFQPDRFLLRKDGAWVLNLAVFALPEKDKEQFLFTTSAEAMTLLDGLKGDPVVEAGLPPGKSVEELKTAAQSTISGLWGSMRNAKPASAS